MKRRILRSFPVPFPVVILTIIVGIAILATGCMNNSGQSEINDVVIPVDSPLSQVANVMQKGGVQAGSLMYEGLVIKDRNGTFDPSLAENWDVSSDAKTWTFHLVRNATWNDGVPFTCADIKFTNDYMKAKNLTMAYVLRDVASINCTDNYTAVYNLKTSYSGFLDQISRTPGIGIYPEHFWKNIDDPKTYQDTRFIGTGPFTFEKSTTGYYQYKPNNAYRGKKAGSGVILKVITNKDSQVLALTSGEIDVVSGITPAVAKSLSGEPNITVYAIPDTIGYEVGLNLAVYPSNITGFRKAMSHAIDRDTISSILGSARPNPTTFLIPSLAGDYVNPATVGLYDYNLTKAQEMLSEAGFTKNSEGKLIGPDGKPVTITIPLGGKASTNGADQKMVEVLRNDWGKLGITMSTLSYDDESMYRKAINANPVFFEGMPAVLHDDADALMNFAVTPLQNKNYYNYNSSEYNNLVSQIKNTSNQTDIREMAYRMQELLAQDVPTIPICSADTLVAYRNDRFTGWENGYGYTSITDPRTLTNLTRVTAGTNG
ncbi:MAG: ABC transporter substrate-binding protein [Methanoregulaceae archaeon]